MFRWPIELTPLSLGSQGQPRAAMLEVTPRGALFTLAVLSHVGHPAHLAVVDAYLKGQVRLTPTTGIGEDCRTVASSVVAPLLAAFELGVERLTLADLVLLPNDAQMSVTADRAADGHPTFGPDSPRFLLRQGDMWRRVETAERYESPGCLGTGEVGRPESWFRAIVELRAEGCMLAELREPSSAVRPVCWEAVASARARAYGQRQPETHHSQIPPMPDDSVVVRAVVASLTRFIRDREHARSRLVWREVVVSIDLVPDRDGYQTLWLRPPAEAQPDRLFDPMRDLAWEVVEGLVGRPLPEHRTEPIMLRLIAEDGRTSTLDVGASVVIGRNQTVFAAWVGSDGRVMIRLLPPGGMPTR